MEEADGYGVFVGNLDYRVGEHQLHSAMKCLGAVRRVQILRDQQTGRHKGCALVHYWSAESQQRALNWQGIWIRGRRAR